MRLNATEMNTGCIDLAVDEPTMVEILRCDEQRVIVRVEADASSLTIAGAPGDVVRSARLILDRVLAAADRVGETCVLCGRRGLNQGCFATRQDGIPAHVGCVADYRHHLAAEEGNDDARRLY